MTTVLIATLLAAAGLSLASVPGVSAFLGSEAMTESQILAAFGIVLYIVARIAKWDGWRWRQPAADLLPVRVPHEPDPAL